MASSALGAGAGRSRDRSRNRDGAGAGAGAGQAPGPELEPGSGGARGRRKGFSRRLFFHDLLLRAAACDESHGENRD